MPLDRLATLIFALVALPAIAAEPVSFEPIAARYLGAETYCETGKWGMRDAPEFGYTQVSFARCAHSDGRFKLIEFADRPLKVITWARAGQYYRYFESGRHYGEYSPDDPIFYSSPYGRRGETYPAFLSRMFPWRTVSPAERSEPARHLDAYQVNPALSTPQHTVYERLADAPRKEAERVWVLNRDQSIVRWEGLRDGVVLRFVEIASQEANRPLADEDLSHDVPLFARFSLQNSPAVFITGLFVAVGVTGMLFWAWIFRRASSPEDVVRGRRRLWRVQFWTFGGIAVLLAGLAVLTLIGRDSGHPPAIVIVIVMAVWCAVAFALMACFTLTSYPAQWLFGGVRKPGEPAGPAPR
ncbi:MAG: hypothetical protein HYY78_12915 [Betaproteobacteria bacterium]|nr:hypothetical protein [Betaproteobacteria bacterium]